MKLSVKIKVNQIQKTTTKCHELRSREAEYTSKVQNAYLTLISFDLSVSFIDNLRSIKTILTH